MYAACHMRDHCYPSSLRTHQASCSLVYEARGIKVAKAKASEMDAVCCAWKQTNLGITVVCKILYRSAMWEADGEHNVSTMWAMWEAYGEHKDTMLQCNVGGVW